MGHFEFADGVQGTVWGQPGKQRTLKGLETTYYVEFDEPQDDGSGDGPYLGAVIDMGSLRHLSEVGRRSS